MYMYMYLRMLKYMYMVKPKIARTIHYFMEYRLENSKKKMRVFVNTIHLET